MHNREEKYSIRKIKNTTASTRIKSKIISSLMSVFCLSSISSNVSNAQQGMGNLNPWMLGIPADAEHIVDFEFNFNDCYIINKYPAGTFKFLKDKQVGQAVPVNVYDSIHVSEEEKFKIDIYREKAKENGYVNIKPLNIVDTKDDKIFAKKMADGTELLQYTANSPDLKKYYSSPFSALGYNNFLFSNTNSEEFESAYYLVKNEALTKEIDFKKTAPFFIVVEERNSENSLSKTGVPYKIVEEEYHGTNSIFRGDKEKLIASRLLEDKTIIAEYPIVNFSDKKEVNFADFSIPKGYELTKEEILSYMTANVPNIDKSKISITEAEEYRIEGDGMDSTVVRVDRDYFTFTDNNGYSKNEVGMTRFIASYNGDLDSDVFFREINVNVVDNNIKKVTKHYVRENLADYNRACLISPYSANEYNEVPNTYPTWELPSVEIPEIPNIPPNTTDNEGTPPLPPEPDPEPEEESTHPNTYPTWELPEAEVGVHPNTYPTIDKPDGDISVYPNTYPTWKLPEAEVGVHPNIYPTTDKPEGNVGINPNTYPTHELPEINLDFKVPNTYPTIEKPEANLDFKIPNTYPTWKMPRIEFPTKPTPPPVVPEDKIEIPPKEKELPKTNTNNTYMYTISSLLGLAILLKRKQKA